MRLPRVRFTIRRMMAAVALVGAALAGAREIPAVLERWDDYSRRARIWAEYERQERGLLRDVPYILRGLEDTPEHREHRLSLEAGVRDAHRRIPYFSAMRRKYERSALSPWFPAPPDPPEPE